MDGYKHYIRTDANGIVVKAFSDAFEQPETTDILIESDAGRHYNPALFNGRMQYVYKLVDGQMVERTQQELDAEYAARPAPPPSDGDRITSVESAILSLMGL